MESSTRGIIIDKNKFNEYLDQYTQQVAELQSKLDTYAGWPVRVTATNDIKKLLFEQMQLPTPSITTDKGEISVSKEALSYVPDTDGIVTLISQIKESRSILAAMKNL
jgi:DNA polymerase I-like protein with 3'-5' exonuclease and polymerase domains